MELQNHSYFVGVQFHPEFKSRPGKPSALFLGNFSVTLAFRQESVFMVLTKKTHFDTKQVL